MASSSEILSDSSLASLSEISSDSLSANVLDWELALKLVYSKVHLLDSSLDSLLGTSMALKLA